jgi:hypothetical protein
MFVGKIFSLENGQANDNEKVIGVSFHDQRTRRDVVCAKNIDRMHANF